MKYVFRLYNKYGKIVSILLNKRRDKTDFVHHWYDNYINKEHWGLNQLAGNLEKEEERVDSYSSREREEKEHQEFLKTLEEIKSYKDEQD